MAIFLSAPLSLKPCEPFLGLLGRPVARNLGTNLGALAGRHGAGEEAEIQVVRHAARTFYRRRCRVVLLAPAGLSEEVDVRQRGRLNLDDFDCSRIERSFIRRVCYDEANRYLVQLGSAWRQYCNVPEGTASGLIEAESASRFFNAHIRGKFVCGEGSGWRD
jgi:KTSC domain-containing protein